MYPCIADFRLLGSPCDHSGSLTLLLLGDFRPFRTRDTSCISATALLTQTPALWFPPNSFKTKLGEFFRETEPQDFNYSEALKRVNLFLVDNALLVASEPTA